MSGELWGRVLLCGGRRALKRSRFDPGVGGDESGGGVAAEVEQAGGGFDGGEAGLAEGEMASVVEEEVGAAAVAAVVADAALDAFEDDCGGDGLPVFGDDVPLDGGEAEFAGEAKDVGAACSVGRAEEVDGGADGVLD